MALYKRNDEWIVKLNRGRYNGKSLAWCVKHNRYWVIETLIAMCDTTEQCDIVWAEIERQRTWGEGCVKCGMRTLHNISGCIECQEVKDEEARSTERYVASKEEGKTEDAREDKA